MKGEARRIPLDFDLLTLGTVVATETLERITGYPSSHKQFALRCMTVGTNIEQYFREARGLEVCVVYRRDTLVVLEDKEASDYTHRELKASVKRMNKLLRKSHGVNVANLTSDEKRVHEQRTLAWSHVVAATNASRREQFGIIPASRTTPKLFPKRPML
jgi:hypothetical protein